MPKTQLEKELIIQQAAMFQQEKIDSLTQENKQLQLEVKAQQPAVEFFTAVTDSKDAIEMSKVAKVLNISGRNKLFAILRNKKVLRYNNEPYQRFIDAGYFRTIEQKFSQYGETKINIKTLVYQKGVDYIRKLIDAYNNTHLCKAIEESNTDINTDINKEYAGTFLN